MSLETESYSRYFVTNFGLNLDLNLRLSFKNKAQDLMQKLSLRSNKDLETTRQKIVIIHDNPLFRQITGIIFL
jgi:hypothetical protein